MRQQYVTKLLNINLSEDTQRKGTGRHHAKALDIIAEYKTWGTETEHHQQLFVA